MLFTHPAKLTVISVILYITNVFPSMPTIFHIYSGPSMIDGKVVNLELWDIDNKGIDGKFYSIMNW